MAQGGQGSIPGKRFAAFISYSHADAAVAAKLHRKLERYRLPKHSVAAQALDNAGLGQIFRDREDLAAAASLSDAIRAAIAGAEALIVICSPDAKASQWVSAEIDLFRELHPDKPVLAALVRGEPAEAFPAALTEGGREPLASDLRPGGDGGSLGFLKIVAGIAGVPLDTLVQRDAHRRVRRVMWITGAALAAMLIMGIMTTLALQARNEAARQRASAEGLVEYMLTDLRAKLKGVGRIDVMEGVNKRAMDHYGQQGDLASLPADSLERRARVLHAMGEDDEKRGNLKQALTKFQEAHRVTAAMLAKAPKDAERLLTHAQSEYWIGFVRQKMSNADGALESYQRYLTLAERAGKFEAKPTQALQHKGWAHNSIGIVFLELKNEPEKAKAAFEKYLAAFEAVVAKSPKDTEALYSLADAHAWMADAELAQRNTDRALSHRKQQSVIIDRLLSIDPANDVWLWSKIGADRAVFRLCFVQSDFKCATQYLDSARSRLRSRAFDPNNRDWLWQSAYVELDRGFLAEKQGALTLAKDALAQSKAYLGRYKSASEGDADEIQILEGAVKNLEQKIYTGGVRK